jgi:hypothetical protein
MAVFCTKYDLFNFYLDINCFELQAPLCNYSEQMFSNWIKEYIKSAEVLNQQFIFVVAGKCVYLAGFCTFYGILAYKFNIVQDIINSSTIHKNKGCIFIYL